MEKTNSVPNRLLILGNGFDLSLGRETRYSDFAKSRFWPENLKSELFSYLEEKANLERWFDLESELARYIQTVRKESLLMLQQDLDGLNKIELILRK